jgi:hypothetical protein
LADERHIKVFVRIYYQHATANVEDAGDRDMLKIFGVVIRAAFCFAVSMLPSSVMAMQDAASEEEGPICVAIGHLWFGTAAERANILRDPVPNSFRRLYNADGCLRFQLIVESLITWHLEYGNAESAKAAIEFLEKNSKVEVLAPELVVKELAQSWDDAEDAFWEVANAAEDAGKVTDIADETKGPSQLALIKNDIENDPAVKNLLRIAKNLNTHNFYASEYTRAAERFQSAELLEAARKYDAPTSVAAKLIEDGPKNDWGLAYLSDKLLFPTRRGQTNSADRQLIFAVLDSRIKRDEASIKAADAVVKASHKPGYNDFLKHAWDADSDACNVKEDYLLGFKAQCEKDNFEENATAFWRQRSQLELVSLRTGIALEKRDYPFNEHGRIVENTIQMLVRKEWQNDTRYGQKRYDPSQAADLLIAWSNAEAEVLKRQCKTAKSYAFDKVLERLVWASTLTNRGLDIKQYQSAATSYVNVFDLTKRCSNDRITAEFQRNAMLFQSFLKDYDRLAAID